MTRIGRGLSEGAAFDSAPELRGAAGIDRDGSLAESVTYIAVCTYCFGRERVCPRCHGSRYELCEEDPGGPGRFIRPASRSEYLHHVREATREARHRYRSAA